MRGTGGRHADHGTERRAQDVTAGRTTPTVAQLEEELGLVTRRERRGRALRDTLLTLITVAAAAVLVSTMLMPVLRIHGSSMTPTLKPGDIIAAARTGDFERGDLIAFWLNNRILVKRVIALPGEWIDIDETGDVTIDGRPLDEPYLTDKARGDCDIELPYQVPDGRLFVMGDHRSTSADSRTDAVGCVAEEQIVGKPVFRIWPLDGLGTLDQ